jgi:anti-anti-sigma regulatory factor
VNRSLNGTWTVERAEELKELLLEIMETGEVDLDFTGVEEADLTFFQLLHAAQKSCRKSGVSIRFLPSLSPLHETRARWTGLSGIVKS